MKSSDIHIRAISQEIPQLSITKICLKITYLEFYSNLPGASELMLVKEASGRGHLGITTQGHDDICYLIVGYGSYLASDVGVNIDSLLT